MKNGLNTEQFTRLQELGIYRVTANDLTYLLDLMPKEIFQNGNRHCLVLEYDVTNRWIVYYRGLRHTIGEFIGDELIDALYVLTLRLVEKGYIVNTKKHEETTDSRTEQ